MRLDKITKRRYDDACAAAHALDLVGERWALLVMRELMLGARRFGELRAALPGISANVLTQRLEGLEEAGVLVRRRLDPPANAQVYELTPWGYEAEPIFQALGRWAARSPSHDPRLPFSTASLVLSLRTMFNHAPDISLRIALNTGRDTHVVTVEAGEISVERGSGDGAGATLTGTPAEIAGVIYAGQPLSTLTVDGDRNAVERFAALFPLPEKVSPSSPR